MAQTEASNGVGKWNQSNTSAGADTVSTNMTVPENPELNLLNNDGPQSRVQNTPTSLDVVPYNMPGSGGPMDDEHDDVEIITQSSPPTEIVDTVVTTTTNPDGSLKRTTRKTTRTLLTTTRVRRIKTKSPGATDTLICPDATLPPKDDSNSALALNSTMTTTTQPKVFTVVGPRTSTKDGGSTEGEGNPDGSGSNCVTQAFMTFMTPATRTEVHYEESDTGLDQLDTETKARLTGEASGEGASGPGLSSSATRAQTKTTVRKTVTASAATATFVATSRSTGGTGASGQHVDSSAPSATPGGAAWMNRCLHGSSASSADATNAGLASTDRSNLADATNTMTTHDASGNTTTTNTTTMTTTNQGGWTNKSDAEDTEHLAVLAMKESERLFSEAKLLIPPNDINSMTPPSTTTGQSMMMFHSTPAFEDGQEDGQLTQLNENRFHSRFSNLPLYQGYGLIAQQLALCKQKENQNLANAAIEDSDANTDSTNATATEIVPSQPTGGGTMTVRAELLPADSISLVSLLDESTESFLREAAKQWSAMDIPSGLYPGQHLNMGETPRSISWSGQLARPQQPVSDDQQAPSYQAVYNDLGVVTWYVYPEFETNFRQYYAVWKGIICFWKKLDTCVDGAQSLSGRFTEAKDASAPELHKLSSSDQPPVSVRSAQLSASPPGSPSSPKHEAPVTSPSIQEPEPPLPSQHRYPPSWQNRASSFRVAWSEMPEVLSSDALKQLSRHEIQMQEAMFEVITSEASYYQSLNVLVQHFYHAPEFGYGPQTGGSSSSAATQQPIHGSITVDRPDGVAGATGSSPPTGSPPLPMIITSSSSISPEATAGGDTNGPEQHTMASPSGLPNIGISDRSRSSGSRPLLKPLEKHHLFSNVLLVCLASEKFLQDLEMRWATKMPVMNEVCDLIVKHAGGATFEPYITYLRNQAYQMETLRKLCQRDSFRTTLDALHAHPVSGRNSLSSFLALPMQRLTRLKLLVDVIRRLQDAVVQDAAQEASSNASSTETSKGTVFRHVPTVRERENVQLALGELSRLLASSETEKELMDQKARLLQLSNLLEFSENVKSIAISDKRLINEGELREVPMDGRISMLQKLSLKKPTSYYFILFNDLLLVTRRKKNDRFLVLDYCDRAAVQATVQLVGVPAAQPLPSAKSSDTFTHAKTPPLLQRVQPRSLPPHGPGSSRPKTTMDFSLLLSANEPTVTDGSNKSRRLLARSGSSLSSFHVGSDKHRSNNQTVNTSHSAHATHATMGLDQSMGTKVINLILTASQNGTFSELNLLSKDSEEMPYWCKALGISWNDPIPSPTDTPDKSREVTCGEGQKEDNNATQSQQSSADSPQRRSTITYPTTKLQSSDTNNIGSPPLTRLFRPQLRKSFRRINRVLTSRTTRNPTVTVTPNSGRRLSHSPTRSKLDVVVLDA